MTTSDWIALGALIVSGVSLAVSLLKDWFTSKAQKIEDAIDRHVQNKMANAQERMVELVETRIAEQKVAANEAEKPSVTAKFSNQKIIFFNHGKSRAVDVSFTVVDKTIDGRNSPFVNGDLEIPFKIEPNSRRSFHCQQHSSAVRLPFTIDIEWKDEDGREFSNAGVVIAR